MNSTCNFKHPKIHVYNQEKHEYSRKKRQKQRLKVRYQTTLPKNEKQTFFCFPPPDFAVLDDGGGTLSFFGAYTQKSTKIISN